MTILTAGELDHFPGNTASFKFKQKTTGSTGNYGTEAVHIMVLLKYLSNSWRTLEILLINCQNSLILTWSVNYIISNAANNQTKAFAITDAKLFVPVVTLSTHYNAKLLQQLNQDLNVQLTGINGSKTEPLNDPNSYLDFLIATSFQVVNRLFVLPFNFNDNRIKHSRSHLPTVEIKDYNVIIDGKSFFDQPIKSYIKNISKHSKSYNWSKR